MGQPELADDARFRDNVARLEHADALEAVITQWTVMLDAEELLDRLQRIGVPCAKVARVSDLVGNTHLAHREQIITMQHPKAGPVPMQGFAVRFGDTPMQLRHAPPMLGQHSEEVLRDWLGRPGDAGSARPAHKSRE